MLASLLLTMLCIGSKSGAVFEMAQIRKRKKEIQGSLFLLYEKQTADDAARFHQDAQHDQQTQQKWIAKVASAAQPCSEVDEAIKRGTDLLSTVHAAPRRKVLRCPPTIQKAQTAFDESGRMIGLCEATLRGTTALGFVAWQMDFLGRFKVAQNNPTTTVKYEVREVCDARTIVFLEFKTAPFQNRTALQALVWKKVSESPAVYVWASVPIERHSSVNPQDEAHAVRSEFLRCFRLTDVAPNEVKLEYAFYIDLKGRILSWVSNQIVVPEMLWEPSGLQVQIGHLIPPHPPGIARSTSITFCALIT